MLPRTGDLLARKYRLGGELGRGAMGIVYEARHETLDQRVAIKILRRSEVDDEDSAVRRFEREARIVAKLDSAHVVKVMDVDRTEDGVPYLVMELLEGHDLSAEVDARGEAPIPIALAVGWMMQVCEAMCVAHEAGVVHRDLKLSNVFLTKDGTVKVLDFGVAVLRPEDPERSATMSVAGTPRYMAPEQLLGEPPNPSSDIWAIGVMLYRTLSGRFPYDSATMAGQMLAMMDGCPPLQEVAPRVPLELAAIVERALGHTPEQRWPSAKALSLALAPFRAGAGVDAKPAVDPRPAGEEAAAVDPRPAGEEAAAVAVRPAGGKPRTPRFSRVAVAALVGGAGLVALGALALRGSTGDTDSAVAVTARSDAAVVGVAPSPPLPSSLSSVGSDLPAGARSATLPLASAPVSRPRAAPPAPASAPAPAPRAPPSSSRSAEDGFPPHL